MSPTYRKKILHILIGFAGLIFIFFLDYLGLFQGIDAYVYDLSFRIRGTERPSEKIVIAAIDEKTLAKYGRWPLNRVCYAELLERTRQASVVGFDVIFAEMADDDASFAHAIRKHGRVVLPAYISRELSEIGPPPSYAPFRTGHIHIEQGVDNVVRDVFHTLYHNGVRLPSLTSALYETATGKAMIREDVSAESQRKTSGQRIVQADFMRINYYGSPGTFPFVSVSDVVEGRYPFDFFNDKVVLVGLTAPGIVDMMATPFSQRRNPMSGVEVHANILSNLFDRNAILEVTGTLRPLLVAAFSLLCFVLFIRSSEKKAAFLWLLSLILVSAVTYILFVSFHRWMGPAVFYSSVSSVFLFAYILKVDEAARKLDAKYAAVAHLLESGKIMPPRISWEGGLIGFLSPGGINTKIQRLVSVEEQYERSLEDTIQQKTAQLSHALSMLDSMSNEIIVRLTAAAESKDVHTGKHISRIGLYASKISEALEMPPAFTKQIGLASTMHDIGKIGIPNRVLLKAGELSPEEFEIVKKHTVIGARILSGSSHPTIQMSATIALSHHERWNGTGYPDGLKGTDIPIEARITMICDIYDALMSSRPYKQGMKHTRTCAIITEGDSKTSPDHFDPDVLRAFIRVAPVFEEIYQRYRDSQGGK